MDDQSLAHKVVVSAIIAFPAYLANVPRPVVVMCAIGASELVLLLFQKLFHETEAFRPRLYAKAVCLRIMALPLLIMIHVGAAEIGLPATTYEYVAFLLAGTWMMLGIEHYIKAGAPGGEGLQSLLDRFKALLQAKQPEGK